MLYIENRQATCTRQRKTISKNTRGKICHPVIQLVSVKVDMSHKSSTYE